jgi:hypothetical protein
MRRANFLMLYEVKVLKVTLPPHTSYLTPTE